MAYILYNIPIMEKLRLDESVDNEKIASQIEQEFDELPQSTATQLMHAYAESYFRMARSGEEKWQDVLFFAGVGLAHAKLHSGALEGSLSINGMGWVVSTPENWDKRGFAWLAIPAYVEGFREARNIVPDSIQSVVRDIYPAWFPHYFNGLDYSSDKLEFLLDPKPAMLPFDHYSQRNFIGGIVHYPPSYERKVFSYMRAWSFPPTMWYSNRPENDFESYVQEVAETNGMSVREVVKETGRHEGTHLLAIDPLISEAMIGSIHCWLSEGIAQYLGNCLSIQAARVREIREINGIIDIADNTNKPVNYGATLLLTMSIAAKLGGSIDNIPEGIEKIIHQVAERARLVAGGKAEKLDSPLELMYWLDPSLREPENEANLIAIMNRIREKYF